MSGNVKIVLVETLLSFMEALGVVAMHVLYWGSWPFVRFSAWLCAKLEKLREAEDEAFVQEYKRLDAARWQTRQCTEEEHHE